MNHGDTEDTEKKTGAKARKRLLRDLRASVVTLS